MDDVPTISILSKYSTIPRPVKLPTIARPRSKDTLNQKSSLLKKYAQVEKLKKLNKSVDQNKNSELLNLYDSMQNHNKYTKIDESQEENNENVEMEFMKLLSDAEKKEEEQQEKLKQELEEKKEQQRQILENEKIKQNNDIIIETNNNKSENFTDLSLLTPITQAKSTKRSTKSLMNNRRLTLPVVKKNFIRSKIKNMPQKGIWPKKSPAKQAELQIRVMRLNKIPKTRFNFHALNEISGSVPKVSFKNPRYSSCH